MGVHALRNPVAIVGMACTTFGEHWDRSVDDLLVEATHGAVDSVPGLELEQVDAFWLGSMISGVSGLTLTRPLGLAHKPVTRVENMCATGSEAFRNACYAVSSGAYDMVMAVGGEKLKDAGYSGLEMPSVPNDGTPPVLSAPAMYSMIVPAYARRYGVSPAQIKEAMTHIAWKNHANGALNPRAQFRKALPKETIAAAPVLAGDLSVFDCSGVADGGAAAVIVRAEDALRYTDRPLYVHALALDAGAGTGRNDSDYDYSDLAESRASARAAYAQAGITDPATEISLAEVHDCFTPTELVLMEELGFSAPGTAWRDVLDGRYDRGGALPVNVDGGLKSFGHPIGASGLRMLFEMWLQFRGEAGERQVPTEGFGLVQNQGGSPGDLVSAVTIVSSRRPTT
ncbi:acetyl-CoA acetyltransferase [Micromonospora echinospora]|uniref:Acetyl-CoA C-acetyltransferase n=1 Tax=Micromonospora echinospora TaxID=1877 RepID=A0A1C4YV25_MICEC|nr:acetyl-CoA acetyltransferase [Micromonospora echinospora]OZV74580.1 acetyl-CoA acetyltransferase [Micromonospora echinospora]SCF24487.1 acetyl-CoA C-acetyltransferase [Micromonospora echinospora]